MKKVFYTIVLLLMFIGTTNAANCNVISGTGKNIGDEIVCGTEHFYVIENNGKTIKMLAKYNLHAGTDYYKTNFSETFTDYNSANDYWEENYSNLYDGYIDFTYDENDEYNGTYSYKYVEKDTIKQEDYSIGAHGEIRGVPEFPEYGGFVGDELESDLQYAYENNPSYAGGGYIDFELNSPSDILNTLLNYNEYLKSIDVNVENINLLSVSEIDSIAKEITGENLPLEKWNNEWKSGYNTKVEWEDVYIIGSLKDYIPEKYSWIWGTTYWTRTEAGPTVEEYYGTLYFVDTWGDICSAYFCNVEVGAGVRPVVTISSKELIYKIETKTDGNGTIESTHIQAEKDEVIKFTIKPNKGYVLKEVKVTDEEGNVITFTENTFTMPESNVIIEATFQKEEKNPETIDSVIVTSLTIIIVGSILTMINIKKMKELL